MKLVSGIYIFVHQVMLIKVSLTMDLKHLNTLFNFRARAHYINFVDYVVQVFYVNFFWDSLT